MKLFLIAYFVLYSLMHWYVFQKINRAFRLSVSTCILIAIVIAFMIAAPVIVRVSEQAGLEPLARPLAYAGYFWMGIIILFVSLSLVIDAYRFTLLLFSWIFSKDLSSLKPSEKQMFLIPLAISLVISLYGYFEALNIRTEEIVIKTKKLPPEIGTLTIANIADVHIGLIVRQEQLRRILAQVKAANPDMLVSSGDLVDGQLDGLNGLSEMLRDINPRFGKYAITGNHEFLAGFEQALDFIERSGFRVIRADAITVAGVISLAGVDDPTGKRYSRFKEISERDLLSGLPKNTFVILLKHRPLVDNNALGLFDLQLSAHTHKGQLFPFSIITYLYYPVHAGLAELPSGSYLHVSRGAGTWGPPIRFLTPPEVTIIKLVSD